MYSQQFIKACNTGKLVLRSMWKNQNSSKNQVTLQFMTTVKRDEIDADFFTGNASGSKLVAFAQGVQNSDAISFTVLFSIAADKIGEVFNMNDAAKKKLADSDSSNPIEFFNREKPMFAADIFGDIDVAMQVERTTVKNPYSGTQKPVSRPDGTSTVMFDGKPVYQHTTLIEGTSNQFIWSGHNSVTFPETQEVRQNASAKSLVTSVVEEDEVF